MSRESGRAAMAKLSALSYEIAEGYGRLAQLEAERARIYRELGEGEQPVDHRTLRRAPKPHVPNIPPPTPLNAQRAAAALQKIADRRRVSR